jgi:carboxyl-terminal processing protease
MRRTWRITAITLFTLSLVLGGLFGNRLLAIGNDTRDSLRLYTELVNVAHERYGAEVSYRDLVYSSVNGMLRSLDPHTSFLSPEAYEGMREKQQTSFYGLGILVGVRNGQLTVISPLEGSPASRMGIQAGDVISTIEGETTDAMTIDDAIQRLKGPKGTQVKITIVRRGMPEPLAMSVTRAEIPQTTVRQAYMVTPDTGYILLTEFSRGTGREMADAIAKLKAQGMKRVLVDLRNNGGGLLDQAIEVADQFLPEDSTIVETRGRTRDSFQSYQASGKYPELGVPVVVLVNEGTASAAEILSGAIQDHDRGLVVGEPSWGKGLVQTVYNLSYGAGLALTTAKYYTPSGRLIQRDYTSYFDYYTHADAGSPEITGKTADPSQIFETDLGRKVYGGGGITPDVLVQDDELLPFEQFLLVRNAYLNFAIDYTSRHKSQIKSASWRPGPELLQEFRDWMVKEKIASAQELDEALAKEEVKEYSQLQIRAEIMNSLFGQEARHRTLSEGDKQLQAALNLFDRAATMLAQRQELGAPNPRIQRGEESPKGKL